MDYFYDGILRLDWGFGNPNKTAAFIAMWVVAFGVSALIWRKAFWIFFLLSSVFTIFLIQTVSRGGMVACVLGLLAGIAIVRPRLKKSHLIGLCIAVGGLILFSQQYGVADRYIQGIDGVEDRSLSNRWLIYRAVPQMLLDAPHGWGAGEATEAFQQWYQPVGRVETYKNLISSHFTWLAEWNTHQRLLYCIGWAWVFLYTFPLGRVASTRRPPSQNTETFPSKTHLWKTIPFTVWFTLFTSSCFSAVAHHPANWILPGSLLFTVLAVNLRTSLKTKEYRFQVI